MKKYYWCRCSDCVSANEKILLREENGKYFSRSISEDDIGWEEEPRDSKDRYHAVRLTEKEVMELFAELL